MCFGKGGRFRGCGVARGGDGGWWDLTRTMLFGVGLGFSARCRVPQAGVLVNRELEMSTQSPSVPPGQHRGLGSRAGQVILSSPLFPVQSTHGISHRFLTCRRTSTKSKRGAPERQQTNSIRQTKPCPLSSMQEDVPCSPFPSFSRHLLGCLLGRMHQGRKVG